VPIYKRRERPEVGDLKMYMGDQAGLDRHLRRGWAVADGSKGTVNLIDRFPKFGAMDDKGTLGGLKAVVPSGSVSVEAHTLSESEMPLHAHTIGISRNNYGAKITASSDTNSSARDTSERGGSKTHKHGASFVGAAHTNEPQHTVCVPLQYVGFAA